MGSGLEIKHFVSGARSMSIFQFQKISSQRTRSKFLTLITLSMLLNSPEATIDRHVSSANGTPVKNSTLKSHRQQGPLFQGATARVFIG